MLDKLLESVESQIPSSLLSLFLSGGIDSSVIAYHLSLLDVPLQRSLLFFKITLVLKIP